ncbi:hypothetical protein Nepgr_028912 [Nepenthes gracilis]|uniref:Uncharacterized protein n=1 Tax=Nepenthes gracilis TaxID=150966 RepID=A0AAD3TD33_NEPGR|nr:hypothetical protein Nepgr_028912 [Nepenthes gracilis]
MAESAEIEGFAEDETTEYPGETVQLGREQSWICPNSKTSLGFEEENTQIESPLRSQGEQRMRISFWLSVDGDMLILEKLELYYSGQLPFCPGLKLDPECVDCGALQDAPARFLVSSYWLEWGIMAVDAVGVSSCLLMPEDSVIW